MQIHRTKNVHSFEQNVLSGHFKRSYEKYITVLLICFPVKHLIFLNVILFNILFRSFTQHGGTVVVGGSHSQHECVSPSVESTSTDTETADHTSDVNMACNDCPPGGAPLLNGVFHCEVCSREFDSLNRFMDHRNRGCVSSENGMC